MLLFPMFMFFLFAFAKIFALLILMQKVEIASFYAARRWQLESHRNASYEPWDEGALKPDIEKQVLAYLGYGSPTRTMQFDDGSTMQTSTGKFLDLGDNCRSSKDCSATKPGVSIQRTQVWNVVTVTACTNALQMAFYKSPGYTICSTKYVPNRDRPIQFVLPGAAK